MCQRQEAVPDSDTKSFLLKTPCSWLVHTLDSLGTVLLGLIFCETNNLRNQVRPSHCDQQPIETKPVFQLLPLTSVLLV